MKFSKHPLGPEDLDLPRVKLDQTIATRLRASFEAITPRLPDFASAFYGMLFNEHPELRRLFPADMKTQQKKLSDTLAWIVQSFDRQDELRTAIRELGHRHERYGALPEHYPLVIDLLVKAMAETAGPAWSREADADWRLALARLSDLMLGKP